MWVWVKRVFFTIFMLFTVVLAVANFVVPADKTALVIILNIVVILLSLGNIVLYFFSAGGPNGLLTFLIVLDIALCIAVAFLGFVFTGIGCIGGLLAVVVHCGLHFVDKLDRLRRIVTGTR